MSIPERIVKALLEAEEFDPKGFTTRHTQTIYNVWEQVGGDVDWWTYGGTFHNPGTGEMMHIAGLESEGIKDLSHWDFELTDSERAQIETDYPVKIDPEFPDDGDENERDRGMAVEDYQEKHYENWKNNLKVSVYRWGDDHVEDWADKFDDISNSMGARVDELSLPEQWQAIGEYFGWEELDFSPVMMTKEQIEAIIKPPTDTSPPPNPPQDIQ
jgi:hypothetical protein